MEIDIRIDDTDQTARFKTAFQQFLTVLPESLNRLNLNKADIEKIKEEINDKVLACVHEHAQKSLSLDLASIDNIVAERLLLHDITEIEESIFVNYTSKNFSNLTNLFKPSVQLTSKWGTVRTSIKGSESGTISLSVDRSISRKEEYIKIDPANGTVLLKKVGKSFFADLGYE